MIGGSLGCKADRGDPGARGRAGDDVEKGSSPARERILLYCGAGIKPPVDELVGTFSRENNVRLDVDYAGSEVLLSRIKLNRKGDLYMPGDAHYVDQADREGFILSRRPVCYFVPTILVRKGNPKEISGLEDLLTPGVRLGLGDPRACAIGRKAKGIFEKNGIPWADVEKDLRYQSLTVNELGLQIQTGSLDAVIVWDAIARYYGEHGEEVPIPAEKNVISRVEVAVLDFTRHGDTAARFCDFAASERGQAIFRKHNYRVDPPEEEGG